MITKKYILTLVVALWPLISKSQTLTGMTGLLNIPSADMQADGTFFMGVNYLPIVNQPTWGYPTGNYYFNLTFLPFLEVAYKCTLLKINGRYTNQDRGASFRLRFIKESKSMPAATVGVHDFHTTSENGNQYYAATYIVFTKHIELKHSVLGITSGYGPNILQSNQFSGYLGGITFTSVYFRPLTLMGEYDSQGLNFGASLFLLNHVYVFSMVQHLQYYAGGVAYKICLK
jgi:hypothetical protein